MNLFNDYKRKIHVLWVLAKTIISKHVSSMWNILGGVFLIDTLFAEGVCRRLKVTVKAERL